MLVSRKKKPASLWESGVLICCTLGGLRARGLDRFNRGLSPIIRNSLKVIGLCWLECWQRFPGQRFHYKSGVVLNQLEQCCRWAMRLPVTPFPMAQGVHADMAARCKLFLCQAGFLANRFNIRLDRMVHHHVHRLASGMGNGLFQPFANSIKCFH